MACVALTSLMATIQLEFLQPNHRVSLDDDKPVKSLLEKLSSLEAFLKEEYSNGGAPIRDLQIKIRDFALKAEDDIEKQLTNVLQLLPKDDGDGGEHQQKQKAHAHGQLQLHRTLQEAAKEAEELLKIINNRSSSEVEAAAAAASHPADNIGSLQCSPQFEDKMVGRDGSFTAIKVDLLHQDGAQNRIVVSIFGAPGVGKTTLCQKLYADEKVVSCFDIKAWVTIPRRRHNAQQLLCHLLQSIRPTPNAIHMGSTVSQLKEQLHKHLKCKRYLIVLEDVPSTLVWDDIQPCFPDDSNASRILLTTLFGDVAKYVHTPAFHISFLNGRESWDLFSHRFSRKQYMAPKFKEIAKTLVEECKGLPRSIVTVADRLSKCNYTVKEWRKIEKELLSLGILHKDTQHSSKLAEIYNRLPQHLKVCFLYFAVFPKHSQIQEERLIRLWIAEGFVKPLRSGLPLEDVAYKYLEDLRSRGLVKKVVDEKACRPKTTYGIHIDMHSFCVREAQKEGLLCAVSGQQCIGWPLDILANSCRWLSLRSHILDYHVLFRSNIPRSLFFFQRDFEMLIAFRHLRVVDLSQSQIHKGVPLPLRNLVFLRYLWVPKWFESLDDVVSANSNLQTLIVSGIDEPTTLGAPTLHLTSKIWELQHLRHLEIGDMCMVDPPNMVKEHLQTLVCAMPIHYFRKEEVYYCRFPSIRKLKIVYKDVLVPSCRDGRRSNPITIVENFEDLLKLEALSVIVPVGSITLLERVGFPANLKELRLSGTNLPVKVLGVIGELPKLEVLKLENIALYGGRVWEVVKGGFHVLKELELEATSVERWVCKGSHQFPKLRRLFLKRCSSLEEIPPRIALRIRVLFSIELEQCPPCVVSSAKRIQKERMRNQHEVPRVTVDGKIISCTKSEAWEEEEEDYDESVSTDSESSEEEEEEDDYYERPVIESEGSEEGSEEEDYDEWVPTESESSEEEE